jgi:hypothetical protein
MLYKFRNTGSLISSRFILSLAMSLSLWFASLVSRWSVYLSPPSAALSSVRLLVLFHLFHFVFSSVFFFSCLSLLSFPTFLSLLALLALSALIFAILFHFSSSLPSSSSPSSLYFSAHFLSRSLLFLSIASFLSSYTPVNVLLFLFSMFLLLLESSAFSSLFADSSVSSRGNSTQVAIFCLSLLLALCGMALQWNSITAAKQLETEYRSRQQINDGPDTQLIGAREKEPERKEEDSMSSDIA